MNAKDNDAVDAWLTDLLTRGGLVSEAEVIAAGARRGLSEVAVRRAAVRIGVVRHDVPADSVDEAVAEARRAPRGQSGV